MPVFKYPMPSVAAAFMDTALWGIHGVQEA